MRRDDWVTSNILRFFTAAIVFPMPAPVSGAGFFLQDRHNGDQWRNGV